MQIRVLIAGAGGSYPPPGYNGPCILVEAGGDVLLLDAGEGCLSALQLHGYEPCRLGKVLLTHRHVDHWAGLPSIAIARSVERCGPLIVHAPWLREDEAPETLHHYHERGYIVLDASPPSLEGAEVSVFPVEHSVPAYGALVSLGRRKIIAYTGDTAFSEDLVSRVEGVSLLVAEATLPSGIDPRAAGMHMTVTDALLLARKAGAGLLALVHLSPYSLEEASRVSSEMRSVIVGEGYNVFLG